MSAQTTSLLKDYLVLGNETSEVRYIPGEQTFASEAFTALEKARPLVLSYFQMMEPFPQTRVVLVTERSEFDRLVRDWLKVEIEIPSHPARLAQAHRTEMAVLSPSAYEAHTTFQYRPQAFRRLLVHEFIHIVEEHLSPNIETSPRWWSEGLAVYLSSQSLYDEEFFQPALNRIALGDIPSLHQVETDGKLAYDWGWTLIQFIEQQYGQAMILRIATQCADGNVLSMPGEEISILEARWTDWLSAELLSIRK